MQKEQYTLNNKINLTVLQTHSLNKFRNNLTTKSCHHVKQSNRPVLSIVEIHGQYKNIHKTTKTKFSMQFIQLELLLKSIKITLVAIPPVHKIWHHKIARFQQELCT